MCFPPLTWQTYDIEHRPGKIDPETKKQGPPTITVRHNGVLVIDTFELKGPPARGTSSCRTTATRSCIATRGWWS